MSLDGAKVKSNASKHKAMSWGYANRLEAQLREEVQTLLEQAARADIEASPGLDIPEELERREARLAAIERAKAEIERRALKRYEAEQAEYEEKLARRRDTEKATGKKARGREPKAPVAGPRAKDQVNFTRLLHKAWHVVVTRTPTFRVASASQNSPCSTRLCHDR